MAINFPRASFGSATGTIGHDVGGFEYLSSKDYEITPTAFLADVWTGLNNDATGSSTNRSRLPEGVYGIWNSALNRIELSNLTLDTVLTMRFTVKCTPIVDNTRLRARLLFTAIDGNGDVAFSFPQETEAIQLDSGAGIEYQREFVFHLYVGDLNSQRGHAVIELNPSAGITVNDTGLMVYVGGKGV